MPYCILTEMSSPVDRRQGDDCRRATAGIAAATTADDLTRTGYQNPMAPYARSATATTPRPDVLCLCAQNAS